MTWTPHLTVAAIIEHDGKFLVVEEVDEGTSVFNQPAGHVEENEPVIDAVIREVREETAWRFTPSHIVGIYEWRKPPAGPTFLRICFAGNVDDHRPEQSLDDGIIAARWLTHDELLATGEKGLRSPLVKKCIDDYLANRRFPLDLVTFIKE